MRYTRDTYLKFNIFCKTVVLETKAKCDAANVGLALGSILLIISKFLAVSVAAFIAVSVLASAGALSYFGTIGALIAANPVFAGLILGCSGLGLLQIIRLIRKKRPVLSAVKEVVVDRYEGDFSYQLRSLRDADGDLPVEHVNAINILIEHAVVDLLNELVDVGELTKEELAKVAKMCENGAILAV